MASRRKNTEDFAEVNEEKANQEVAKDFARDNPDLAADALSEHIDFGVVNEDQAELSEEGEDADTGDTVSAAEVSAANMGRAARGEEPVVPGNVEEAKAPVYQNTDDLLLDGVGMDPSAFLHPQRRVVHGTTILETDPLTGEEHEVGEFQPKHPEVVEAVNALNKAKEDAAKSGE